MATIKAHTDIEQSRKLAEILSTDTADICLTFVDNTWNPVWGKADEIYQLQKDCYEPDYTKDDYVDIDEFEPQVVPCWSLAALLEILAKTANKIVDDGSVNLASFMEQWSVNMFDCPVKATDNYDNPIDACYEMIIKLHKLNLL